MSKKALPSSSSITERHPFGAIRHSVCWILFLLSLSTFSARGEEPMPITILELGSSIQTYGAVLLTVTGTIRTTPQGLILVDTRANGEEETVAIQPTKQINVNDFVGKPVRLTGKFVSAKENLGTTATGYFTFDSVAIEPTHISLVELLVRPEKYDGVLVVVAGYYVRTHTGALLFLSREHGDYWVMENMVPLEPNQAMQMVDDSTFVKKYVRITGVFTAYHPASAVVAKGCIKFGQIVLIPKSD